MSPQQSLPQKPISKAALIGLICSAAGLCLPPLALVGLILGIVGIVKTSNNPNLSGKVLGIVAVCLAPCAIFTTGILAAIAIPNFIRFQARSKQGECRATLKTLYAAQKSFFMEHDAYTTKVHDLAVSPERGNRYAYFIAAGPIEERSGREGRALEGATGVGVDTLRFKGLTTFTAVDLPPLLAGGVRLGVSGKCPEDCSVTMACIGNVGRIRNARMHQGRDVWSISTKDREAASGDHIGAGVPYNDSEDLDR